jgi:hypothetical protein
MGGIFRIAPPLTIAEDELQQGLDILDAALAEVTDVRDLSQGSGGEMLRPWPRYMAAAVVRAVEPVRCSFL